MTGHSSKAAALLECPVIYTRLTTHKEKWARVFRENFFGFQGVCITSEREILHSINCGCIGQRLIIAIAVTVLTDKGIPIRCSVRVTIAIAITITCDNLEVSK